MQEKEENRRDIYSHAAEEVQPGTGGTQLQKVQIVKAEPGTPRKRGRDQDLIGVELEA